MTEGQQFSRLVQIMHRLRQDCPWDRSQTHESLRAYLLEEAYEVLHALDDHRFDDLREELGDLLLQVVFHAEVAREAGRVDIGDVLGEINEKLVRRHPHVFEDAELETAEDVLHRWEQIKTRQEAKQSLLAGVPAELPALLQAVRVVSKIRRTGADPMPAGQAPAAARRWLATLAEATESGDAERAERAIGMLGVALTAMAGRVHVNPEDALRRTVRRMAGAFRREERELQEREADFHELPPEELDRIAERIRRAGREGDS